MEGGGHALGEELGAERVMDDYLRSVGLLRKKVAKDGSCLFRAVAEQVLHSQSLHTTVRAECVEFLKQNRGSYEAFVEGDFEDYLFKLQDPQQWVGEVEINALAAMYKKDFLIYQEPGKPPVNITDNNFKDKVRLCFLNGNHYDSVYPASHIKSAALCQSVLYELLYDGVFKVDRSALGACQRVARSSDVLSEDSMAPCASSDESDLDAGEPLWVENGSSTSSTKRNNHIYRGRGRGRGRQLPERVRRSLNPTLFRNVQYDVWNKTKTAQQKMDYSIAAGMQYTVGDRCQVRLEGTGRSYNAVIKEVPQSSKVVMVHIEELGKRHVPLCSLRPPSDEKSWSTVVGKDKRLHNGSGEREERGKGRGRAAASAGRAAASAGRVQNQHSWPPQASADEQGGAKPSRKSVSSVESPWFGLTEEERSAREEERRNVALVEIQLRDEHSFPALGNQAVTQGTDGRRKSGEKKGSQRSKTKSPVEDVGAASPPPSAAERPKSSSPPPLAASTTTPPPDSAPPADAPPSDRGSLEVKTSNTNMASGFPPTSSSTPPLPPSHCVPCSATVFLTPVLPTASPPPTSSVPAPTFIAPIAPSPLSAQGFHPPSSLHRTSSPGSSLPHSPSPPPPPSSSSSALVRHVAGVVEAPPVPAQTPNPLPDSSVQTTLSQNLSQTRREPTPPQTRMEVRSQIGHLQDNQSPVQTQTQYPSQAHNLQTSTPVQPAPPPSQQLHPSLCISASPTHPSLGSHTPITQNPAEAAQPGSPAHLHFLSAPPPPPLPQPVPGAVPLQNLAQLYQDPLYPGFPQEEGGNMAPTPPFSCSGSGEDLPRDFNILRFFFNLGVKAYSMPLFPPYLYLLPLQQAHTMYPRQPSRSPSPTPHLPPSRHQEAYLPYTHQAPPIDPPRPSEPSFRPAGYPVTPHPPHQMPGPSLPWQRHQMAPPANSSYSVGYTSVNPAYAVPPPSSQGYHLGQVPGQPLCPPYPSSLLAYQSSSDPQELQAGHQPTNGNTVPGPGHVPVLLEAPATNVANANNHKTVSGVKSLVRKKEQIETRTVLLVDPPLNNTPIPVSMTTMKPGSSPGSPSPYSIISKTTVHGDASVLYRQSYITVDGAETGRRGLSVGCSTEDDWEEVEGFNPPTLMHRGPWRIHRGGPRGRGGAYDGARGGNRRRQRGNAFNHGHFGPSNRGQGW